MASISAVTAGGLVLDIAGALLLALGLMFKKPRAAVAEATPRLDFNVDLEANLARQTADAQAGALLLIIGFGAQLAAASGWREGTELDLVFVIGAAVAIDLTVAIILLRFWRPYRIREMLAARLAHLDLAAWWPAFAAYGPWLGRPAPADISIEVTLAEYGKQLLGTRRWRRLLDGRPLPDVMTKLRRDLAGTSEYEVAHPQEAAQP